MLAFLAVLIINVCWAATIPATPENITVTFLTPTAVRVAWQTLIDLKAHPIEKYIVTYKPADDSYRVVQDIAGNSEAVILDRLSPGTQYSIAVTAIWLGKKYRSRQIIFRTLDSPKMSLQQEPSNGMGDPVTNVARPTNGSLYSDVTSTASSTFPNSVRRELPQIRGVEVGIVFIVLMVWAGAIALFFNRWGKIRMLLPYQPDYKHEQLKVPGTGVCSGGVCSGQHSHQFEGNEAGTWTYQSVHCNNTHFHTLQEAHSASVSERCSRSRINSAIFVSTEGKGFDSIEFLRRHGSQSVLCRKAKSAENVRDHGTKRESAAGTSQWGADEGARAVDEQKEGMSVDLELRRLPLDERHGARTLPVLNLRQRTDGPSESTLAASHSAAVITSDAVVGSISIEAPPAYLRCEMSAENSQDLRSQYVEKLKTQSASRYSTDTMEEFIVIPQQARQHKLVYQRSSSSANPSQSSAVSIDNNDHAPSARGCRPKVIISPVVSVTEPSPPHEASDVASECL